MINWVISVTNNPNVHPFLTQLIIHPSKKPSIFSSNFSFNCITMLTGKVQTDYLLQKYETVLETNLHGKEATQTVNQNPSYLQTEFVEGVIGEAFEEVYKLLVHSAEGHLREDNAPLRSQAARLAIILQLAVLDHMPEDTGHQKQR